MISSINSSITAQVSLTTLPNLLIKCFLKAWFHACLLAYIVTSKKKKKKSGCKALPQQTDNILHTHNPDVYHYKAAEHKDFMLWNNIGRFCANCYRKLLEEAHKQLTMGHSCFC